MKTHLSDTTSRRAPSGGGSVRSRSMLCALAVAFAAAFYAGTANADEAPASSPELKLQPLEEAVANSVEETGSIFKRIELDRMVKRADWIIHADIASSESRWAGGNIETSYQVNVRESLKGDGPATFELTVKGGQAPNGAPIAQYVAGTAQMGAGEEVVLFLRKDFTEKLESLNSKREQAGLEPMRFSANSRLAASPRIVGKQKGKFNVLTLGTGQKVLTRLRPAPFLLDAETNAQMLDAVRRKAVGDFRGGFPADGHGSPDGGMAEAVQEVGATAPLAPTRQQVPTYSPSGQSDPNAPELAVEGAKSKRPFIPFNADAMGRPVLLSDFKKEVARLTSQAPKAPAKAAEQD